jgi:hypothetical protein
MREPKGHPQTHRGRRCACILLVVAFLVLALLVVPVMGVQAAQIGEPIDSPNPRGADSISANGNRWSHHHRFYLPPLNTVNWD